MNANVKLDHEPVADGGWLLRALLSIEGDVHADAGRTPLNLSLVLDRSGSMAGPKLDAVKEAATLLARRLAPTDTLSVVAYAEDVSIIAPPAAGAEQPHLTAQIRSIGTGGCTNLSGGWLQGRKFVSDNAREGSVNRVLLLTDGLANRGITDPAQLVGLCREAAAQGITTTTIGFGADYDEHLLSAMADAGRGGAYYIENPDQAPGVFDEELKGLLSIAAQNVKVDISTSAHTESCRVLHSYPSTQLNGVLTLEVGDLYSREPRPVLAEFLLKPPAAEASAGPPPAEIPVATVVVLGNVLTAAGGIEEREIVVPIRLSPVEGGIAEPTVRRELTLLEAAEAREIALRARTEEQIRESRERFARVSQRMHDFDPNDAQIREEVADLDRLMSALEVGELGAMDRKYVYHRADYARKGRYSAVESVSRERREERLRRERDET